MLQMFQVDAFTNKLFGGNPAAVVMLDHWLEDHLLQSIAAENNLAETAYLVPAADSWELRWFTPTAEVALCGHATLAAAHVLVSELGCTDKLISFKTRQSGTLVVEQKKQGALAMSFPAIPISTPEADVEKSIALALGAAPTNILQGHYSEDQFDFVALYQTEADIAALRPDLQSFKSLSSRGVIVTAKGDECDFVSRYFAPNFGIDEDPVTGSAHCLLAPYWSDILDKNILSARQISPRGGELTCELDQQRVILTGHAVSYLAGNIYL